MTREPIPRFDLYAELEVSRSARAEVIEAAYRTLAKLHHPDVSAADDDDPIKRLNLAHEWLSDPLRRRRYDNATRADAAPRPQPTGDRRNGPPADSPEAPDAPERWGGSSSTKAFGVNTAEVREFLADLRSLDGKQAAEMHAGKAAVDPMAYAVAQHVAATTGRAQRQAEWLLAREAASVIARGKVPDSQLQAEVAGIVADIAGAIAIRDLIPQTDFQVLLEPWAWRDEDGIIAAAPVAVVARPVARAVAHPPTPRITVGRTGRSVLASPRAVLAMVAVFALVATTVAVTGPKPNAADARTTDPPVGTQSVAAATFFPGATPADSAALTPGVSPVGTEPSIPPGDGATSVPATLAPGQTPKPTPRFTPVPTRLPTPVPTVGPTTVPTPGPTPVPTPVPPPVPTPVPSPSPQAFCTVPNFVGANSSSAMGKWTTAGFTGAVIYSPTVPPSYPIAWQSLAALSTASCTSDVTVAAVIPSP